MVVVLDDNDEKVLVCSPCLAAINSGTPRTRSGSVSSVSSVSSIKGKDKTQRSPLRIEAGTASNGANDALQGDRTLNSILKRLQKMDDDSATLSAALEKKLDERFKGIEKAMERKIDERCKEFEASLQVLHSRTDVLDQLPALFEQVAAYESRIEKIEQEKARMNELIVNSSSSVATDASTTNKLLQLEAANRTLARKVSEQQAKTSTEIIISGLQHQEGIDLKALSLAVFRTVLRTVQVEIEERDVVSARPLMTKKASIPMQQEPIGSKAHSPPIVVTLATPVLARSAIMGKIKYGISRCRSPAEGWVHLNGSCIVFFAKSVRIFAKRSTSSSYINQTACKGEGIQDIHQKWRDLR